MQWCSMVPLTVQNAAHALQWHGAVVYTNIVFLHRVPSTAFNKARPGRRSHSTAKQGRTVHVKQDRLWARHGTARLHCWPGPHLSPVWLQQTSTTRHGHTHTQDFCISSALRRAARVVTVPETEWIPFKIRLCKAKLMRSMLAWKCSTCD